MKIALVKPKNRRPNPIYLHALESFRFLELYGYETKLIEHNMLNNSYDGYILVSDHLDHPVKAQAFLDNKPVAVISGPPLSDLAKDNYIRVIFNGITPNFGTWNFGRAESALKDLNIELPARKTIPPTKAVITPNNFHTDITYGKDMGDWVIEVLDENCWKYDFITVKFHPKLKVGTINMIKKGENKVRTWANGRKNIEIIVSLQRRNTKDIDYDVCYNFSSTASVEAAYMDKNVISYSPGDFMYGYNFVSSPRKHFGAIAACTWKYTDMEQAWLYNKSIFENVIRHTPYPEFTDEVLEHFTRRADLNQKEASWT